VPPIEKSVTAGFDEGFFELSTNSISGGWDEILN